MAMDARQKVDIIEAMDNFMERRRPPENIRHEVDLSYKIENQSVILFEVRPRLDNPEQVIELPIAKATFVKTKKQWNVFWQRADLKWHSYPPKPTVQDIQDFIRLVDKDTHGCFWG
jgi:hypothetical protein